MTKLLHRKSADGLVLQHALLGACLAASAWGLAGCASGDKVDTSAEVVTLPASGDHIDFDDAAYTTDMQRVLIPARDSGVYLVDPATGTATHVPYDGPADSVDADTSTLFVADRSHQQIRVIDPETGKVLSSVPTASTPDYVRYVRARHELWVSEPAGGGIQIFGLDARAPAPILESAAFVPVPDGPEGLTLSRDGSTAYTHAGSDLVTVDTATRRIVHRWDTGCEATHGFPRVDTADGFILASCAEDGRVVLLDRSDGSTLGDYSAGGGESLPAFSDATGHFYVRSDPGDKIVVLIPSTSGLEAVADVEVPEVGHCLGAQADHYWTCDADGGRILVFTDAP